MADEKKRSAAGRGAVRRAPAGETSLRRQIGDAVKPLLPATVAARRASDADQARYLARGETGRAVGAALRQAVTVPNALLSDVLGRPAYAALQGGQSVLGGAVGSDGDTSVRKLVDDTPPAQAVDRALAQGRKAQPAVAPQDLLMAQISEALKSGVTYDELIGYAGAMPAPGKAQTAKDKALGTASSINDTLYQSMLNKATALPEGEARDEAVQKATERYLTWAATIGGANAQQLQLQDLMDQTED